MEGPARDDRFGLVTYWTIDNFSCWDGDVHDPALTIEESFVTREAGAKFELYPRGIEDRLSVRLKGFERPLRGDLSFFGSDGTLLCTREVKEGEVRGVVDLPPGPKFQDVVEHVRNGRNEDRLTLRMRFFRHAEQSEPRLEHQVYSAVEVFESTVQIHLEQLAGMRKNRENYKGFCIMEYPLMDGRPGKVVLAVSETADLIFGVEEEAVENKCAIRTTVSLLNGRRTVLRSGEYEHIFRYSKDWVIPDFLTEEDFFKKGYLVVINFKFIPGNGHKFLSSHTSVPMKAFERFPKRFSRCTKGKEPLSMNKLTSEHPDDSTDVLKADLMCLFQDQDFSDFRLKCGDITFPVHKNILSSRSPVFKTMLSTDMKEAASSEVVIEDLDPSTLALFLTFLYTGVVEDLQSDRALKLYYAADKYQVPTLLSKCTHFLSSNVSVSNVCDVLSLAERHRDDELMSVSHTFILKNFSEVLASEHWDSFRTTEPELALETLTQFAKNKKVTGSE